jgi:hypothetical protein
MNMEFKRSNKDMARHRRVVVPTREGTHFTQPQTPQPAKQTEKDEDWSLFGPDTTPEEMDVESVGFKDILGAWSKQAVRNTPLERHLRKGKKTAGKISAMKNDLKWALMADLDEPVKPREKAAEKHQQPTQPFQRTRPLPPAGRQPILHKFMQAPSHALPQAMPTPPPAHTQSAVHAQPVHAALAPKAIAININIGDMPKIPFHKLKELPLKVRKFITGLGKKQRIGVAVAASVVVVLMILPLLPRFYSGVNGLDSSGSAASQKANEKPDFHAVLPTGKSITDLGGWKRISPPGNDPVFAYADNLRNVRIAVSQQPLPASFRSNVDANVSKLAKDYAATKKVSSGSTNIYIGTSYQGPQSVIFSKNDLLILIKSDQKIEDNAWAWYADQLN